DRAVLSEGRLVVHGLFLEIGNVAVAAQADVHAIGFGQSGLAAGMRTVARGAVARSSGVLHPGSLDLLALVVMAGEAESLDVGLRQHYFAVLGRRVAGLAPVALEGRMLEFRHQFGRVRLVRIMALHAIGGGEGLVVMRLFELGVVYVVAIETQRG